jgi:hypothetical protein
VTGAPAQTPAPANPRWVRIAVIALLALIWIMTLVIVVRGDPWREPVFWAVIGTICLSAVDIGTGPSRRRGADGPSPVQSGDEGLTR